MIHRFMLYIILLFYTTDYRILIIEKHYSVPLLSVTRILKSTTKHKGCIKSIISLEMDVVQHTISYYESDEPKKYIDTSHTHKLFEVLQSSRKNKVLCDIWLETDDGTKVCAHKVVLLAASSYFCAMFTGSFNERNKDHVNIRELDSNVLQLLVDFIYTGEILVTEQNVQVLFPAANLLQLDYVKDACIDFMQKQLRASNCLGIKGFADLYNCTELSLSSDEYIKKQFSKVIEAEEFLSLSYKEVIELISRDDIHVPSEEKVFECVINWVKHELSCRDKSLPILMQHVRLPLASKEYLSKEVVEEPLLKNSLKCKDFLIEALNFHILKTQPHITIPQTIHNTPRQSGQQVILIFNYLEKMKMYYMTWYDPVTNIMQTTTDASKNYDSEDIALTKEHFVFALGAGFKKLTSVHMLDLFSITNGWVPMVDMTVSRRGFGVGVVDDCIYVVGGQGDDYERLKSVEVFDGSIQKWRLVSSMSTQRSEFGVGILNNLLYAVGGFKYPGYLNSVECYDPRVDTWTQVANMSESRHAHSVAVLDGVMYAIGGNNGSVRVKSVEAFRPSDGVWYSVADMHLCRANSVAVALHGLLYVIGGTLHGQRDSVDIYNPNTNTWSMKTLSTNVIDGIYGALTVYSPPHFRTD